MKSLHLKVHGRVQGVFFRAFTRAHAVQLGLKGSVKNLIDGTVDVYAEGEEKKLKELIDRLSRGPPGAKVEKIGEEWGKAQKQYADFEVER